jgi:hypothetical protein
MMRIRQDRQKNGKRYVSRLERAARKLNDQAKAGLLSAVPDGGHVLLVPLQGGPLRWCRSA